MGRHDRRPSTQAENEDRRTKLSNWGRFGPEDELGTLDDARLDPRAEAARGQGAGIPCRSSHRS